MKTENVEAIVTGSLTLLLVSFIALPFFVGRIAAYESKIPCDLIKVENIQGHSKSTYRVFCQQETLDIKDDVFTGNFRSSDLYGRVSAMEPGTRIYFDGYGYRIGFLSMKRKVFRFSSN